MRNESRSSLLAKVHIAKKDLNLPDDTYRDLLERVGGNRSAAKLTDRQLVAVVAELRAKGWQPKAAPSKGRKPRAPKDAKSIMSKIEALLAEAKRPWAYVESMGKRMYGVERLEWCTADQLHGIMVALIKDAKRNGRRTA